MIAKIIIPDLPRTTTRKEWRDMNRWRRVTQKLVNDQMRAHQEETRLMISELMVFGSAARVMMIDRMVNPPVIVYGYPPRSSRVASMIDAVLERS